MQQILDIAQRYGKKVAFCGRSMENIVNIAKELGYIHIPTNTVIPVDELKNFPRNQTVAITSGSQGEPMSALSLMADNMHKHLKLKRMIPWCLQVG